MAIVVNEQKRMTFHYFCKTGLVGRPRHKRARGLSKPSVSKVVSAISWPQPGAQSVPVFSKSPGSEGYLGHSKRWVNGRPLRSATVGPIARTVGVKYS
jgi:hypothetical protein